ncbi:class IIb bacteriocin, lactobin A/cerein 7B family [Cylindrospermopsis raciborskii]|uniref:Class IIb bacteriocin, lactobin A/cerein 7B family n=1 Tax=Cylindrospermopsis raciborskii CS-506_A TaxID=2585140 RepID=A0A838WKJ5_9CYAN|nr:class IIb bacteriocin, lactobin A/cerein 7B family [Cylindrospermopsis raciborskii]MBA4444485.1 class IIb bacteriocin, lactobin A/cerein 7B family [Cylindrospermopsis raciborskii CS-506_C]MBA4448703.1 class IIb bacteriocin, lactobin A/cerein 7B family [Cylindrospermopsis raciborskii CS-506_D]MBA4455328.1 class IIb bacteriocin, lactobin A/cerein 7B family [Cylindrospermopsis raciborskii CS-506_B]MBA4464680.1 class IIb bacteriocin, lactobin A/cerein 7B family [Cylindrospermopsis raciborskii CS
MANISISDLRPAGVDFFSDSESFLDDLNDNELYNVSGGLAPITITVVTSTFACGLVVGIAIAVYVGTRK